MSTEPFSNECSFRYGDKVMQIVAIPEKYRGQQNTVSLSAMFVRNVIIQMRDQSTDQSEIRDFYHKCQGHLE